MCTTGLLLALVAGAHIPSPTAWAGSRAHARAVRSPRPSALRATAVDAEGTALLDEIAAAGDAAVKVVVADLAAPVPLPEYLVTELSEHFPTMSTARKLVRKGIVLLNGERSRCELSVRSGDQLVVLPRHSHYEAPARARRREHAWWESEDPIPPSAQLLSSTRAELADVLCGSGRASTVWDCLRRGEDPSTSAHVTERTKSILALARLSVSEIGTVSHRTVTRDGTAKLLLRLADGLEVETVLIPWPERGRTTICVSSQVGCAQACSFCATGRMGRLRSLSADEILVQAFHGRQTARELGMPPLEGVVFMGMGEAADNADEVVTAARALGDDLRFRFSRSRITISTIAPTPQAFADLARSGCVLAWSVHAADDALRKQLVPTTRHSMAELRDGLSAALLSLPKNARQVMIEVVLIEGVNDEPHHAAQLLEFLEPLRSASRHPKVMVDLIPYNAVDHARHYRKPSFERVTAFQRVLIDGGMFTFVRTTRGDDGDAACGQLATRRAKHPAAEAQGVPSAHVAAEGAAAPGGGA